MSNEAHTRFKAAAAMLSGCGLLTLNDAVAKVIVSVLPVGQLLFVRSLFFLIPFTIAILIWRRSIPWRVNNIRVQAVRAALIVAATICFMLSLRHLPLGTAVSILFSAPLIVAAAAGPGLGERVGRRRWFAAAVGLLGLVLIMTPQYGAIGPIILLPLAAAVFAAGQDLVTRAMAATESSLATLWVSTVAVGAAGFATLPVGWPIPSMGQIGLMALAGILLASANYLLIEAFRQADASWVAPFRYSTVLWALLLGWLVWGETVAVSSLVGVVVIFASWCAIVWQPR